MLNMIQNNAILKEFITVCGLTVNGTYNIVKILRGFLIIGMLNTELKIKSSLALDKWSIKEIGKGINYKRDFLSSYTYKNNKKTRTYKTKTTFYKKNQIDDLIAIYKSIPNFVKVFKNDKLKKVSYKNPLLSNDMILFTFQNIFLQNSNWETIFSENGWSHKDQKIVSYRDVSFFNNTDIFGISYTSSIIRSIK